MEKLIKNISFFATVLTLIFVIGLTVINYKQIAQLKTKQVEDMAIFYPSDPFEIFNSKDPFWNLPKEEVAEMWNKKEISDEKANDYVSVNLIRQKGLFGMERKDVAYAYERGHITESQAITYLNRDWLILNLQTLSPTYLDRK